MPATEGGGGGGWVGGGVTNYGVMFEYFKLYKGMIR